MSDKKKFDLSASNIWSLTEEEMAAAGWTAANLNPCPTRARMQTSPPSRTKNKGYPNGYPLFFMHRGLERAAPVRTLV